MIRRVFLDHPAQVGETYGEHFGIAARFGLKMAMGGGACLAHAIIPALFPTTGSDTVNRLYDQMIRKRAAKRDAQIDARVLNWVI